MEDFNYEQDIRIDAEMLEFEWIDQPQRMLKYCTILANASRKLDLAKESLDMVRAELDRDIRTDPDKFGITTKLTEEAVKNTILLQGEYMAANHAVIEARFFEDMAKSAVRAFDQRKDALENLVRLLGQSYFAGPKVPHDLSRSTWKKEYNPKISLKRNR